MQKVFRRNGNSFEYIGLLDGGTYKTQETEIGTWIDNKILYRNVCTPTSLTLDNTNGDAYHNTYRTDIAIQNVDTMVSGTFLGTNSDNIKFSAPCEVFIKNGYLHISSFATLTVAENGITIIVEYTKATV